MRFLWVFFLISSFSPFALAKGENFKVETRRVVDFEEGEEIDFTDEGVLDQEERGEVIQLSPEQRELASLIVDTDYRSRYYMFKKRYCSKYKKSCDIVPMLTNVQSTVFKHNMEIQDLLQQK